MCWKCGKEIDVSVKIYRDSECSCGADLHSCKNCKFYSQNSHYECKETIEDFVSDKESRNFCDYFSPLQFFSPSDKQDKAQKAKDAFNSLFGGIVCL